MEIAFTHQQEQRLTELARHESRNVGELLLEAADSLLRSEDQRWKDVEHAMAQADLGDVLDEEEMDRLFVRMLQK